MRNRMLLIVVLIALGGLLIYEREKARRKSNPTPVAAAVKPAPSESPAIEGAYRIDGKNPDGGAYSGSLVIEKKGDRFIFLWKEGSTEFTGIGLRQDSVIAVTLQHKDKIRTALYKIVQGKLEGKWLTPGDGLSGHEVWIRQ